MGSQFMNLFSCGHNIPKPSVGSPQLSHSTCPAPAALLSCGDQSSWFHGSDGWFWVYFWLSFSCNSAAREGGGGSTGHPSKTCWRSCHEPMCAGTASPGLTFLCRKRCFVIWVMWQSCLSDWTTSDFAFLSNLLCTSASSSRLCLVTALPVQLLFMPSLIAFPLDYCKSPSFVFFFPAGLSL